MTAIMLLIGVGLIIVMAIRIEGNTISPSGTVVASIATVLVVIVTIQKVDISTKNRD
jgi:hypothetical protein